jgi:hypothetical protein
VARRTMTLKRIDPWSVLKFGFLVNLCLLVVALLAFAIVWFTIRQLGIIEQACQLALDVGFEECGVDGGALFRVVLVAGALGAVIMTGIAVFSAFLHNLLADLVGGIKVTFFEEGVRRVETSSRPASASTRPRTGTDAPSGTGGRSAEAPSAQSTKQQDRWTLGTPPPASEGGTDSVFSPRDR